MNDPEVIMPNALPPSHLVAHLQLLVQVDAVDRSRAASAIRLFYEVRAMTWRLLHPRA